jgi:hypothetical protein
MKVKPEILTFILFLATLIAILISTWIVGRWPQAFQKVTIGLLGFVALLFLVTAIGTRKTT